MLLLTSGERSASCSFFRFFLSTFFTGNSGFSVGYPSVFTLTMIGAESSQFSVSTCLLAIYLIAQKIFITRDLLQYQLLRLYSSSGRKKNETPVPSCTFDFVEITYITFN